jgi:hypothetical protein
MKRILLNNDKKNFWNSFGYHDNGSKSLLGMPG